MKLAATLLTLVLLVPVASADYTHMMGDAAGTATVDEGPARPDTLWRRHIGGTGGALQPPLIHNGEVFVASLRGNEDPRADVWRLDLETGEGGVWLHDLPAVYVFDETYIFYMVIADGQLIVNRAHGLAGYDLDGDGSPVWTWDATDSAAPHLGDQPIAFCMMAGEDGRLVASCLLLAAQADETPRHYDTRGPLVPFLQNLAVSFHIDTCRGPCEPEWTWNRDALSYLAWPLEPGQGPGRPGQANAVPAGHFIFPGLMTIADGLIAFSTMEHQHLYDVFTQFYGAIETNFGYNSIWVLDAETGTPLWDERSSTWASAGEPEFAPTGNGDFGYLHYPVIHDDLLFYALDRQLRAVGVGVWTGWEYEIGAATDRIGWAANSITIRDPDLWVASTDKVFRLDVASRTELAQGSASGPGAEAESWVPLTPLLLAGDTLYAASRPTDPVRRYTAVGGTHVTIHAFDADTLASKWRLRVEDGSRERFVTHVAEFAASAGIMILHTRGGDVIALGGEGGALAASGPALYPAPGDEVTVTVDDEADAYQFDWGDGSGLEWTAEPTATHTFERPGDYEVWAIADKGGHWTSSHWTVHVGGTPPVEQGLAQRALAWAGLERLLLVAALGLVAIVAAAETSRFAHRRREREREGREERQLAYGRVLAREVEHGAAPEEVAERLRPLRGVLGIADREHARLEAEARALRVAAAGGARPLVPGERFLERYEVERQLGAGGAGLTYLCRDVRLGRSVVLKVLRTAGDDATESALQEARAFAAVVHDRVVTLHDVEQVGGDVFLVLEHVDGPSLAERLADGPLGPEAMRRLADDLLSALQAVHGAGLVHRDVKPANVLVTRDGSCKLGDFGLASAALDDETAVGFDGGAGTARYMAPEQARGERIDARSDLYAAALTLYEAWTGTPYYAPHPEESLVDVHMRAAHGRGSLDGVPAGSALLAFFARALSVDPAGRFQDAAAMRAALLGALDGAEDVRRETGRRHGRDGRR